MERQQYIVRVLEEHLENGNTYTRVNEKSAINNIQAIKNKAIHLICNKHKGCLTQAEMNYFTKSFKINGRVPQFYGMPKIHKGIIDGIKLRPVISQCGSISAIISTFLDYRLQYLKNNVPSYIKDSADLINQLKQLGNLQSHNAVYIFTSDATSMYTNIDIDEGISTMEKYLRQFAPNEPIDLLMDLLTLVMKNNIFQFGSTWWKQHTGTTHRDYNGHSLCMYLCNIILCVLRANRHP